MALDLKQIEHIAHLARLELSAEEKERFGHQLADVLAYFEKLKELDTANVEPTGQCIDLINIYKDDALRDCEPDIQDKIIDNFSDKNGRYNKVNKIL